MNSIRKATIIAGILFIVGTIAGILSIAPTIDAPDYLTKAASSADQVIIGAIFQFVMAVAYIGFAIYLYPIIKKYNESLAIGFVGFRFMAGVFNVIGVVCILLILTLSQAFVKVEASDLSYYQICGELLRMGRDLGNHVAMVLTHSIGGLMLYYACYQYKLVPRWLSVWGFVGVTLTLLASILVMFRFIGIVTPIYIFLSLPLALQEMVLAVVLIVKGFSLCYAGEK